TIAGMRLEKALGYFARGAMPPRTETNLLSLGVIHAEGMHETLDGKPLVDVRSLDLDGSGFYWLIPTHLRFREDGVSYNAETIAGYVSTLQRTLDPSAPTDADPRILDAFKRNGYGALTLNGGFAWDWNPTTGVTQAAFDFSLDGGFAISLKGDL